MSRQSTRLISKLCLVAIVLTGCHPTQPFYFHEDGDLSHYVGRATQIEEPDVEVESLPDVKYSKPPMRLDDVDLENVWELTLDEAIKIALANAKVLKTLGGAVSGSSPRTQEGATTTVGQILQNPDGANTIYNPAIQETGTGRFSFGPTSPLSARRGPEAALAEFDTDFMASIFWQKNDNVNNFTGGNQAGFIPQTFQRQNTANLSARLQKVTATGTIVGFQNLTTYDQNNNLLANPAIGRTGRVFPSEFRTEFEMDIRQPLLRFGGIQYNRIAGQFSPFVNTGGSLAYDGVLISRIDTDQSLTDLELAVRNHVRDVERAYWELYAAYRRFDVLNAALESAREIWELDKSLLVSGSGEVGDEERSREQYYAFRARAERQLWDLLDIENGLRYMMGLATTDCRLIRPADEPLRAEIILDWHDILGESLARSAELRRIRWNVEKHELALVAAKNGLLPSLDAVARYRWKGFGDRLIDPGDNFIPNGTTADPFRRQFDNAFGNLLDGKTQEWELGLQFEMTIGFREALSEVRQRQFVLAREKAVLKEAELELSHLLADRVRQVYCEHGLIETYANQIFASREQITKFDERHRSGEETNERLLDAEIRGVQARLDYWNSVVNYNQAIADVHFQKGSILEHHNVLLAEGPWPGKAYFDAVRLARQRDASMYLNYGTTQPAVLSRGPYAQNARPHAPYDGLPVGEYEPSEDAEELPLPEPEDSYEDQREQPEPDSPQPDLRFTRAAAAQPQATFRRGTGPYAGEESVLASDAEGETPIRAGDRTAAVDGSPARGNAGSRFRRD